MQQQLDVSSARWWHYPGIARFGLRAAALPRSLVIPPRAWSPLLAAAASALPPVVPVLDSGLRTFVLEERRSGGRSPLISGVAQTKSRREPDQWELAYFAVLGGVHEAPKWVTGVDQAGSYRPAADESGAPVSSTRAGRRTLRLLSDICERGAEAGVVRIFARIPSGPEYEDRFDLFRQVGFVKLVGECGYYRSELLEPDAPPSEIEGLSAQQRSDAFGILQLYQATTPRTVQMAEGLRSQTWDLPATGIGRRMMGRCRIQRWVVRREGRIVAWLQLAVQRTGPHGARLMVDPMAQDFTEPLVDFALHNLAAAPGAGVLFRVREHQRGVVAALESRGFRSVQGQLLIVKLMAVPVPMPQFVPALENVV